jgi:hypothetical protein
MAQYLSQSFPGLSISSGAFRLHFKELPDGFLRPCGPCRIILTARTFARICQIEVACLIFICGGSHACKVAFSRQRFGVSQTSGALALD